MKTRKYYENVSTKYGHFDRKVHVNSAEKLSLDLDKSMETRLGGLDGTLLPTQDAQIVQVKYVDITAAQINAIDTTPITVLPALPTGYTYVILDATLNMSSGTAATTAQINQPLYLKQGSTYSSASLMSITGSNGLAASTSTKFASITTPFTRDNSAITLQTLYNGGAGAFYSVSAATTTAKLALSYIITKTSI